MKKILVILFFILLKTFSYSFTIQNSTGKFEIGVG